jgi:hypothetical protein
MIGAMASPTSYEIKIPAEYQLSDNKPQRMIILVEQPAWATSEANIRLYLTEAIAAHLVDEVGLKAGTIATYREVADVRNTMSDFEKLSPVQVGRAMKAQMVLYVMIDNFGLYGLSDAGYYKGQLATSSGIYDVATGEKLWPQSGGLKANSVGFELAKGQDEAAKRLAESMARCIVRNLYDCSKRESKVADESGTEDLKNW